jgi:hypothetical protein
MGLIHQWCLWIDSPVINIHLNHDISSSAQTKIRAELNVLLLERLLPWVKIRCIYMSGLTRVCPGLTSFLHSPVFWETRTGPAPGSTHRAGPGFITMINSVFAFPSCLIEILPIKLVHELFNHILHVVSSMLLNCLGRLGVLIYLQMHCVAKV